MKPGDISFCFGYIKKSDYSNREIAEFIRTWSPDAYKKQIPCVFRSKIDRVVTKLNKVDYDQLVVNIDLIKNSQLSVREMVKLITGNTPQKKKARR